MDPEEASTFSNRSLAYIKKKQYSKSIEDANTAIEKNPEYIKAYYRRGKAYEMTKKYDLAIKDYEHILEQEPKNKRIKKELLSLRAAYKDFNDSSTENKKFKKMTIQEGSSNKVEEIHEAKPAAVQNSKPSQEPVIQDEGEPEESPTQDEAELAEPLKVNEHIESTKSNVKVEDTPKSEFVKLDIEEAEDSSEDDDKKENMKPQTTSQETPKGSKISKFDKDLLKYEQMSDDFINSLEAVDEKPKQAKVTEPKATEPENSMVQEVQTPKVEEKKEPSPEEKKEDKLLEEIDSELAKYKQGAKKEHEKGMFDHAVEIYQEALIYIELKEHLFKHKSSELVIRKCTLWNNIAACYKQYQNQDKEIEFTTFVINSQEHLKGHPNILFKAKFRRGCAYEKAERFSLAKADLQFCRENQPFNMDVTNRMKHIKEALEHEEQEKKTRSMISPQKLIKLLEKHKTKGNTHFKAGDLGKLSTNNMSRPSNRAFFRGYRGV